MKTSVYLALADPELGQGPRALRQLIALHSLLFRAPVIQDNFFLSRQMCSATSNDPLVSDLAAGGELLIALRTGVGSLAGLLPRLIAGARQGRYLPFPGESIALYESENFRSYVECLSEAFAHGAKPIAWEPAELGTAFKAKMANSAELGEWDADSADNWDAFDAVERIARSQNRVTHSCSDYWTVADQYFKGERNLAIKSWARSYYLTNLPDVYGLGTSLPASLLVGHRRSGDMLGLPWIRADQDVVLSEGLLSPMFLASVRPDAIRELRQEDSFKRLQEAMEVDDSTAIRQEFTRFAQRVYDLAPAEVPGAGQRIAEAEAKEKYYETAAKYAPLVGGMLTAAVGFTLVFLIPFAAPGAALAGAAGTVAAKLGADRKVEAARAQRDTEIQGARTALRKSRLNGDVLSLVDFCHREPTDASASDVGSSHN